jgi:CheY-like chemotaxis protein
MEPRETAQPAADGPVQARLTGKVLLAEDNDQVAQVIARTLERAGLEVILAVDGDQALQQMEAHSGIALLLVGGVMPGADSGAVVDRFWALHRRGKVILCSGHTAADLRQRGCRAERGRQAYCSTLSPLAPARREVRRH